ncbi:hypothetical protein [Caldicellulosiruptor morganii]|uniref:Uncharacterized protein n=1 Tax=Caldicellulosiruptor morganii TaxID=1387555 RepID=A0ABY7BRW7_9FIRM|nr:hypothetical protein [Caldicellulosiruptor morganii]WAM33886.1 hypothetical protein OTK00_000026 [Caldicellulosiruptor morganii]
MKDFRKELFADCLIPVMIVIAIFVLRRFAYFFDLSSPFSIILFFIFFFTFFFGIVAFVKRRLGGHDGVEIVWTRKSGKWEKRVYTYDKTKDYNIKFSIGFGDSDMFDSNDSFTGFGGGSSGGGGASR